jgi:nicotinamidase/pyrazinamidase
MTEGDALLIVDVQNDFCPGGALAVPGGDRVAGTMTEYAHRFRDAGLPVYASRDWHPAETQHFKAWGGPWPPHCVQGTQGAAFHPALHLPEGAIVVSKGDDFRGDSYSAFLAHDDAGTSLADLLHRNGIRRLFVGGLATDYCVRASVLDASRNGFDVVLLEDAIGGIDVQPGDVHRALAEMQAAGASTATLGSVVARSSGERR